LLVDSPKPAPSSLKEFKTIKSKFFSGFYLWHFRFHFLFLEQTQLKLIFLYLSYDAKISFVFSSSITEYRRPFIFLSSHNFGLIIGYGGGGYHNVHLIEILMTCFVHFLRRDNWDYLNKE
jgi:hypothetical protein